MGGAYRSQMPGGVTIRYRLPGNPVEGTSSVRPSGARGRVAVGSGAGRG
jgi:hypothetical protein